MSKPMSICEILASADRHDGWLYLPPGPWTPETLGVFANSEKDADPLSPEPLPEIANAWKVTIDSETVEDIVLNAIDQLGQPCPSDLFEAFVHYVETDGFIVFSAGAPDGHDAQ